MLKEFWGYHVQQLEKVKNSSPKKLSADCWPTVRRQSTDSRPTVVYRLLRKSSAGSRPTVGRLSADCWPHVGNLLAKCRLRTLVEYQKSLSSQGRTFHIDAKCFHFGLPFTIYVAITFCPFVSLEQRALALALFHISQLNNGMRYQTVLEQVTLQSSKGIFRE